MTTSQSGIGRFVIGESAIGIRPLLDFAKTIISQYQNSPTLYQLIQNFFDYIDPSANLDAFFDMIWNLDTAQGYGLDVWGRIVGVERVLRVPDPVITAPAKPYFGFKEANNAALVKGFGQAIFYGGGGGGGGVVLTTTNYVLSDGDYHLLILAKALANISNGSVPSINQILQKLFPGRGNCYVIDNLNMTMTVAFRFILTPVEWAIVSQSGVLPRPCGVAATFIKI